MIPIKCFMSSSTHQPPCSRKMWHESKCDFPGLTPFSLDKKSSSDCCCRARIASPSLQLQYCHTALNLLLSLHQGLTQRQHQRVDRRELFASSRLHCPRIRVQRCLDVPPRLCLGVLVQPQGVPSWRLLDETKRRLQLVRAS